MEKKIRFVQIPLIFNRALRNGLLNPLHFDLTLLNDGAIGVGIGMLKVESEKGKEEDFSFLLEISHILLAAMTYLR
jgi:hypothetical protein